MLYVMIDSKKFSFEEACKFFKSGAAYQTVIINQVYPDETKQDVDTINSLLKSEFHPCLSKLAIHLVPNSERDFFYIFKKFGPQPGFVLTVDFSYDMFSTFFITAHKTARRILDLKKLFGEEWDPGQQVPGVKVNWIFKSVLDHSMKVILEALSRHHYFQSSSISLQLIGARAIQVFTDAFNSKDKAARLKNIHLLFFELKKSEIELLFSELGNKEYAEDLSLHLDLRGTHFGKKVLQSLRVLQTAFLTDRCPPGFSFDIDLFKSDPLMNRNLRQLISIFESNLSVLPLIPILTNLRFPKEIMKLIFEYVIKDFIDSIQREKEIADCYGLTLIGIFSHAVRRKMSPSSSLILEEEKPLPCYEREKIEMGCSIS